MKIRSLGIEATPQGDGTFVLRNDDGECSNPIDSKTLLEAIDMVASRLRQRGEVVKMLMEGRWMKRW